MRARWYSASNARWERLDPFNGNPSDPFSFNKYAYVHGDPVGNTDPTGEESLSGLSARMSVFTSMVASQARLAFATGPAAIGAFFNKLGDLTERFVQTVLTSFSQLQVAAQQGIQNSSRIVDFVLRNGNRSAQLEVKYRLPISFGDGFNRLVKQIQAMVASGNGQVVVWTVKPPAVATLNRLQTALGDSTYNRVQFIDGLWGLQQWIQMYFRIFPS